MSSHLPQASALQGRRGGRRRRRRIGPRDSNVLFLLVQEELKRQLKIDNCVNTRVWSEIAVAAAAAAEGLPLFVLQY